MKLELFQDVADCWRWRLVGGNGEILATSEAYAKKSNAMRTMRLIRDALTSAAQLEVAW
jgi:hypothetical protein